MIFLNLKNSASQLFFKNNFRTGRSPQPRSALQKLFFKIWKYETVTSDLNRREFMLLASLLIPTVLFGFFPNIILDSLRVGVPCSCMNLFMQQQGNYFII
uniref:Uncharacterized protein n=1 Tax=Rhizoctonia solani TaxID=456999 RepID=N0ABU0_9AGAM|nr:hypothetical protein RSOL_m00720 [Rhizoctonia solani]AGK45400.1 hypothetical protein RSOL_m00720 [Rhizoctonia solani]